MATTDIYINAKDVNTTSIATSTLKRCHFNPF